MVDLAQRQKLTAAAATTAPRTGVDAAKLNVLPGVNHFWQLDQTPSPQVSLSCMHRGPCCVVKLHMYTPRWLVCPGGINVSKAGAAPAVAWQPGKRGSSLDVG